MLELSFAVEGAQPVPYAAVPQLLFKLRIGQMPAVPIHSIALRCQVRIEPTRRRYVPEEQERLRELFGKRDEWKRSLRGFLWTQVSFNVPGFTGDTLVDLPVPCTFDFTVASTKYFDALGDGEIPLCLLFSGTVFYEGPDGGVQATQIPWDREADFRLPVRVWKSLMEQHYPNTAWLALHKDAFDRLHRYKRDHGLTTWEETLENLLTSQEHATP